MVNVNNLLSKVFSSKNSSGNKMQPYYPLTSSGEKGPYDSIENVHDSLKQDFFFLLFTEPGEWPMNPNLGVGLKQYLFENYNSSKISDIAPRIQDQLNKFLPRVRLLQVNLMATNEEKDMGILRLRIKYSIMNNTENVSTIEIGKDGYLKVKTESVEVIDNLDSSEITKLRSDETIIWGY